MSDPSLAVQKALYERLKSNSALQALVGARIYDRVPANVVFPYVELGHFQAQVRDYSCLKVTLIDADIRVWSRAVGQVEVKDIASAISAALHRANFALQDPHALVHCLHRDTNYALDADGLSESASLGFDIATETPV